MPHPRLSERTREREGIAQRRGGEHSWAPGASRALLGPGLRSHGSISGAAGDRPWGPSGSHSQDLCVRPAQTRSHLAGRPGVTGGEAAGSAKRGRPASPATLSFSPRVAAPPAAGLPGAQPDPVVPAAAPRGPGGRPQLLGRTWELAGGSGPVPFPRRSRTVKPHPDMPPAVPAPSGRQAVPRLRADPPHGIAVRPLAAPGSLCPLSLGGRGGPPRAPPEAPSPALAARHRRGRSRPLCRLLPPGHRGGRSDRPPPQRTLPRVHGPQPRGVMEPGTTGRPGPLGGPCP